MKVIDGRAELNIQPFLDSLSKLDTESAATTKAIDARFKALASTIANATSGLKQALSQLNAGAAGGNVGSQQVQAVRQQAQQAATAQRELSGVLRAEQRQQLADLRLKYRNEETAQKQAIASIMAGIKDRTAAENEATQKAFAARLVNLRTMLAAEQKILQDAQTATSAARKRALTEKDPAQQRAALDEARKQQEIAAEAAVREASYQRQITQVMRSELAVRSAMYKQMAEAQKAEDKKAADAKRAADKQAADAQMRAAAERAAKERALLTQQARQLLADQAKITAASEARERALLAKQTEFLRQKLDTIRRGLREEEQALSRSLTERLRLLRVQNEAQARAAADSFSKQAVQLQQQIAQQKKLVADMQKDVIASKSNYAATPSAANRAGYQNASAMLAATIAKEESLHRQLTQVVKAEYAAQDAAVKKSFSNRNAIIAQANREFKNGVVEAIKQAGADARDVIKDVEDRWNSIFRAGTQLTSVGNQMLGFAGNIREVGNELTQTAGDFDYWAARAVAAARAANGAITSETGAQLNTVERYRDEILKLGRDLGTLSPTEVAQSWFTFQAALGQTITTEQDLALTQSGLNEILKASIITNTNHETAIKGVAQVMGEYGLGLDKIGEVTHNLVAVTQRSQAEFSDVLESYKMVGPLLAEMDISLADTSTMFTILAEAGLKGSMAGRGVQMMLTRLLDATGPANEALTATFDASGKLANGWRDVVFEGGKFIGFLDKLDEQGNIVTEGFFRRFAEATKNLSSEQRAARLAEIFPENAFRNLIPLVRQYADEVALGKTGISEQTSEIARLQKEMNDLALQASLFNDQWGLVGESIKVRYGQAMYGIQESLIRLGYIAAERFLPMLEWVDRLVKAFMDWAAKNPALAESIVSIVTAVAALTAIGGAVALVLGQIMMGVAATNVVMTTFSQSTNVAVVAVRGFLMSLGGLLVPVAAVAAAVGLLYLAWKYNFAGMGDSLGEFFGKLGDFGAAVADAFGTAMSLLNAVMSGQTDQIAGLVDNLVTYVIEALVVLPNQIAGAFQRSINTLGNEIAVGFRTLAGNMAVWGYNLMISLANGIYDGTNAVGQAVWAVAEYVASFFRSYSPPKYGPLMGIWRWGRNLIGTFVEGMNAADLEGIKDVAGRIGDALKLNIEFGGGSVSEYAETMQLAYNKIAEMVAVVKGGGTVTEEFFGPLQGQLGEWYDNVVQIGLAYQRLYGLQRQLTLEQEKLDVIKQQRAELDAMADARTAAFDRLFQVNTPGAAGSAFANVEKIDPTTAEGKAKIEEMRRKLSREDFQNWIAYQKSVWEEQDKAQNETLSAQETAQDAIVEAAQKQVDLAKQQYDYYLAILEYAKEILGLQKDEESLASAGGAGGGGAGGGAGNYGTPEQLAAYRQEISGAVGGDSALVDEATLSQQRGGDDVGAYADAVKQREREEARLSELEKLNRKKRADFERQLIEATSEEERDRIKQEKDAWDAAYREEKARLQERAAFAREVVDAAETQVDGSMAGRVADEQKQYASEIRDILGEQAGQIKDANTLKEQSGDLDAAQVAARSQMREEERKLQDLQQYGDQKKLEFEERLREAKDDPEATRRIKEEQDAWEAAYKRAIEAQQERVNAARRAQQDLGDEEAAARELASGASGGGAGKAAAGGGGGIPDRVGGIGGAGLVPTDIIPLTAPGSTGVGAPPEIVTPAVRESFREAGTLLDDLKRAVDYLNDESVSSDDKVRLLGDTIKEIFGWETWWDALGPEELRTAITDEFAKTGKDFEEMGQKWNDFWSGLWESITGWWADVDASIAKFNEDFNTKVSEIWERFTNWFAGAVDALFLPLYVSIGAAAIAWEVYKAQFIVFWESVQRWWTDNVSTPFMQNWNEFWTWVNDWWVSDVKDPFMQNWNEFWSWVLSWWVSDVKDPFMQNWNEFWSWVLSWWNESVKTPFMAAWSEFWGGIKETWDAFTKGLKLLWDILMVAAQLFIDDLRRQWDDLWAGLKTAWETFTGWVMDKLKPIFDSVSESWGKAVKDAKDIWQKLTDGITNGMRDAETALNNVISAIRTLANIGRSLLGVSNNANSGNSNNGTKANGSFAVGLRSVPFDGFIGELHKGERILTAAEAKAYNELERLGLLSSLADAGVGRAAGGTVVNTTNSTVRQGDRITNVQTGPVYAGNPSQVNSFIERISFLSE